MRAIALAIAAAASLAACSPYSPGLPSQPFLCGSTDPKCPDGFTCMGSGAAAVCVGTGGSSGVDAGSGSGGGNCSDDSMLEPNDTIQTAYVTPVATQRLTLDLAGLAICPSGDKDTYKFSTTVNLQNADASVTYSAAGVPLQMAILGSGGQTLVGAVSAGANKITAHIANLPVGDYYVQVFGPTTGGTNGTYELTLAVSGP